jgi:hypothetical protein
MPIAGCRWLIHGLEIGDCRLTLDIDDSRIGEWRLAFHFGEMGWRIRQSAIASVVNPNRHAKSTTLQSANP